MNSDLITTEDWDWILLDDGSWVLITLEPEKM